MITLSGIVTRHSIILVDFIHLLLARGRSLFDAIMENGTHVPCMIGGICHVLTIGDLVTDLSQIRWNHAEKPVEYRKCGIGIRSTVTSQVVPRKQLNDSSVGADRVASGAKG